MGCCRSSNCCCQGHIAVKAEKQRSSPGRLWRSQREDQAKSDIHPCARQPHVGRAQRRARRYVGGESGEGGGGRGDEGGEGGGDEDWFKLLSNCLVIHHGTSNVLYVTMQTMRVYKTIDLILTTRWN